MRPLRVEVDDEYGTVAMIIDLDQPRGTAAQQQALATVADDALQQLAALPGVHGPEHAAQILLCALTREVADQLAYERIANRPPPPAMTPLF